MNAPEFRAAALEPCTESFGTSLDSHARPAALDAAGGLVDDCFPFPPLTGSLLVRKVIFIFDLLSGLGVLEVFGRTGGVGTGASGLSLIA